jgi:hypothetical protein
MLSFSRRLTRCLFLALATGSAACDTSPPVAMPAPSDFVVDSLSPRIAYLTYVHAGRTDTLWAGSAGGLVANEVDVYLDVGGVAEEATLGEFFRVHPAQAVDGEIRWSPYLRKVYFRLHDLERAGEVSLHLRAGLPRTGADPFPHDQRWRLRREAGATMDVTIGGPGVLKYATDRYTVADGAVADAEAETTFYVPADTVRVHLAFSRPMDQEQVEARLRRSFERARSVSSAWEGPRRLTLSVAFPPPSSRTGLGWDSHYVTLGELADERGLPVADPREVIFETGPLPVFHRWREAGGVEPMAVSPPRLLTQSVKRSIADDILLIWHFEEEVGDYWGVSPWLVDLRTGEYRAVGPSQAGFEALSGQWFPGEPRAAVSAPGGISLIDATGEPSGRLALGDSVSVLEFALHPRDGRVAVLTVPLLHAGDEMPVSVVVFSAAGEFVTRASDIGIMAYQEVTAESLWPHWMPDGRLAFLLRKESRWTEGRPVPRRLAFLDASRSQVEETEVEADSILGADSQGSLLLDGNRLYERNGQTRRIAVRGVDAADLVSLSPDGKWFAATGGARGGEIGIVDRTDGRWRRVGQGTVLGWSPESALHWMGPSAQK